MSVMRSAFLDVEQTIRTSPAISMVIAGWTGRDRESVERHVAELAAIGVPKPSTVPCFYRVSSMLVSTASKIQVVGTESSGEAEYVLLSAHGDLWIAVGSDHTDRCLEMQSVAFAKQVCPKPISRRAWKFLDVGDHWDDLILRSFVTVDGNRELYQEGSVSTLLPPLDLVCHYTKGQPVLPAGTVMFCGTLPVIGGIRGGEQFEVELEDPVLKRRLEHKYTVHTLPLVS